MRYQLSLSENQIFFLMQVSTNMVLSIISATLFCPALIVISSFALEEALAIQQANGWGATDGVRSIL